MQDLQDTLNQLPHLSGVYLMLNREGVVIYVGKAKDLKKRVASYFLPSVSSSKTRALVTHIHAINTLITETETEALRLENDLIKQYRPKYNVIFRDDKSYPYIYLSGEAFPRLTFYRGSKKEKGQYFGPYPNSTYARQTLHLLQRIFLIRSCRNGFFSARSRPCLQYQIHRCSAPCVQLISPEEYALHVQQAKLFLTGRSLELIEGFAEKMKKASQSLNYELAAQYRDKIKALKSVQHEKSAKGKGSMDSLIILQESDLLSIFVFMVRGGKPIGSKSFFRKIRVDHTPAEWLSSFILQYYSEQKEAVPFEIVCRLVLPDQSSLEQVLTSVAGHGVSIKTSVRGARRSWYSMAVLNAKREFDQYLMSRQQLYGQFVELQHALSLERLPEKIECFDISHTQGVLTVASCVVFGLEGALKAEYRSFNITGVPAGDDVAAMGQALERRYRRVLENQKTMPDLIVVAGGGAQLQKAMQVMKTLGISQSHLIGIAKDENRKSGQETIYQADHQGVKAVVLDQKALLLLLKIRDEAHRFAVFKHRQRRVKKQSRSALDQIKGVGQKRRTELLRHFGGLQGLMDARAEDIKKISGINAVLAKRIYESLRLFF